VVIHGFVLHREGAVGCSGGWNIPTAPHVGFASQEKSMQLDPKNQNGVEMLKKFKEEK
jgi:hypothetical protein